jgi:hypothetical protein
MNKGKWYNQLLLIVGCLLLFVGLVKPDLNSISIFNPATRVSNNNYVFNKPNNKDLLEASNKVIEILKNGPSSRKSDNLRLAQLYHDIGILISLDGEDEVIKDTAAIKQANTLAGVMLRLNLKDKYENLSTAMDNLIKVGVGDDDLILDKELRQKSVDSFNALSWACYEASK